MRSKNWLWVTLIFALVLSGCAAPGAAPVAPAADGGAASSGAMTFVNTPRNETLIIDNLNGAIERPENFNPFTPGVEMGRGYHEICLDNLWEIDTTTGEILWADEARGEDAKFKLSIGGFGGGVDYDDRQFDKVMKPVVQQLVASIKAADL